jgi:hypothetical protein
MKNLHFISINILAMSLFINLSSCICTSATKGNKIVTGTEIAVSDYSEIQLSVPGDLVYRQDPDRAPYFQIATDENILPLLVIEVKGNRLTIKCKDHENIHPSQLSIITSSRKLEEVKISGSGKMLLDKTVKADEMDITVSGSGKVQAGNLQCKTLNLNISGSGSAELKGSGKNASYTVSGSGNIRAYHFPVKESKITISGSGSMEVNASEKLNAKISGSGSVKYRGKPQVDSSISGSGKIRHD